MKHIKTTPFVMALLLMMHSASSASTTPNNTPATSQRIAPNAHWSVIFDDTITFKQGYKDNSQVVEYKNNKTQLCKSAGAKMYLGKCQYAPKPGAAYKDFSTMLHNNDYYSMKKEDITSRGGEIPPQ